MTDTSTAPADAPSTTTPSPDGRLPGLLTRPVAAGLILLIVYAAVSLFMDPRGFLGTDTGGKVATVKTMSDSSSFDPDLGYWAEAWDPDAAYHPMFFTARIGDRYVNVTTLPMVLAARPLYDIGGERAILLLPMLGSLAAAFGARSLSRRLGSGAEWTTFWLVGLASPAIIYALDFWEHSIGLALMTWALVGLLECWRRPRWAPAILAGVGLGAAGAMRTEAFAYAVGSVGLICGLLAIRREILGAIVTGAGAVAGFALPFLANNWLESVVLGTGSRAGRVTGAAGAGGSDVGLRIREGLVTTLSPFPGTDDLAIVYGAVLVAGLGAVALFASRAARRPAALAAGLVVVVLVLRMSTGPGFVPGMLASTPFAVAGLVLAWGRRERAVVAALGLVSLPLVFAFQFTGGAGPQWGGRYILTSGLVLMVVGIASYDRMAPWAFRFFAGVAILITIFGLVWQSERTHAIAATGLELSQRPEQVLIWPNGFLSREFGAFYPEIVSLTTSGDEELPTLFGIAESAGFTEAAIASTRIPETPATFAGWEVGGVDRLPFLDGSTLYLTRYTFVGAG